MQSIYNWLICSTKEMHTVTCPQEWVHPCAIWFCEVVDCLSFVPPVGPTGMIRFGDFDSQRSFGKIKPQKKLLIFLMSAIDMQHFATACGSDK